MSTPTHEWTVEQKKWLVEDGGQYRPGTEIWRAFCEHFGVQLSKRQVESMRDRLRNGQPLVPKSTQRDLTQDVLHVNTKGALILSDLHIPAHDPELLEFAFALGSAFGVESCVMNGDVFDFHRLSSFDAQLPDYGGTVEEELALGERVLAIAARSFKTYMDLGNHEWRLWRRTLQAGIVPERMARLFSTDSITLSAYSFIILNDTVRVTHPRNYSQVRTSVSSRLAEKYHQHVVMGHTHYVSYTLDRSGRYVCIESGACADPARLDYIQSVDSVNPAFMQGFVILTPGGELLLIDGKHADREWWLATAKRARKAA